MRRHWFAPAVIALALAVVLAGCGKGQGGQAVGPPGYSTADLMALEQHSPFALVIPVSLPLGYGFTGGTIVPDPVGNDLNTKVNLTFGAGQNPPLQVTESRGEIRAGGPATEITLPGATAQLQEVPNADGSTTVSLVFAAKGLFFVVTAQGISRDELIRVAESLSEQRTPPIAQ